MKMYRPDNWKYLKHESLARLPQNANPIVNQAIGWDAGFEAGADAMLEALDKIDVCIKYDGKDGLLLDPAFGAPENWTKGKLIFIPDK